MQEQLARNYRNIRREQAQSWPWASGASHCLYLARAQMAPGPAWEGGYLPTDAPRRQSHDLLAWSCDDLGDGLRVWSFMYAHYDNDWTDESPLTIDEATDYLRRCGVSRGRVPSMAREAVRRYEYTRTRDDREAVGLVVEVTMSTDCAHCGTTSTASLGDASCWGYETTGGDDAYLVFELADLVAQAMHEANREQVAA